MGCQTQVREDSQPQAMKAREVSGHARDCGAPLWEISQGQDGEGGRGGFATSSGNTGRKRWMKEEKHHAFTSGTRASLLRMPSKCNFSLEQSEARQWG